MIKVPLITMDANSRSLGTFIENFKGIIDFESYNDKVLDSSIPKMVVFFEYVGDNDLHFENFANFFKPYCSAPSRCSRFPPRRARAPTATRARA